MTDSGRAMLVVVVEDDPSQLELFRRWLERAGYEVATFGSAEALLAALPTMLPEVVCLDLHLPGLDGLSALEVLHEHHPLLPVIVLTADTGVDTVVRAMRLGAYDYLVKPVDRTRFETQVRNAAERSRLTLRVSQLERESRGGGYAGMVGESDAMRALFRQLDRVGPSDVTVLIHGESGSGKELVARALHQASAWRRGPFVAVNCAAIADTLQESELFGHERGAFTGAESRRIGRFEEADGGSLFLDEVAELDLSLQPKLLRVLQERRFRRLGGQSDLSSRFRLIAASHRDLARRVAEGAFREDLFYRVAVFELEVPALRERIDDLELLSQHFLARIAEEQSAAPLALERAALVALEAYEWPGNVRELENAMRRAAVLARDGVVRLADLPPRVVGAAGAATPAPPAAAATATPAGGSTLEQVEARAIAAAVAGAGGNLSAAARRLGIGRTTLYRKLRAHGLE